MKNKKSVIVMLLFFAIAFTLPVFLILQTFSEEPDSLIGVLIFCFIDIILWSMVITTIVKTIKVKKIAKDGKEFTANFVSYSSNVKVNEEKMYKIMYTYQDEFGNIKQGESGSDYTIHEANIFRNAGTFKIKAIGDDSVIMSTSADLFKAVQIKREQKQTGKIKCPYCLTVYSDEKTKCPACGAGKNLL